jgi:hypothetical protein
MSLVKRQIIEILFPGFSYRALQLFLHLGCKNCPQIPLIETLGPSFRGKIRLIKKIKTTTLPTCFKRSDFGSVNARLAPGQIVSIKFCFFK